jgi:hypothetical protein
MKAGAGNTVGPLDGRREMMIDYAVTFQVRYVGASDTKGSYWFINRLSDGARQAVDFNYEAGSGERGKLTAVREAFPLPDGAVLMVTGWKGLSTYVTAIVPIEGGQE